MKLIINWRGIFGLPSKYIGAVYNKNTRKVCKIINPTYDYELEDTCWTASDHDSTLIKLPRKKIPSTMSLQDCALLIENIEKTLERL